MFFEILILILGFALLIIGADILIKGASNIAKKFNIPDILIGLTIVSLGTTLPELVVSVTSAATGSTDIVFGNVVGSNICNLLLILGLIAVFKPIKFEKSTIKQNLPLLILLTSIIFIFGLGLFSDAKLIINRIHATILLFVAVLYFFIPIMLCIKNIKKDADPITNNSKDKNTYSLLNSIIYILLGGLALKYGGDFVVNSATNIAYSLNISERVIGLTIVAVGTSLPELITSIVAILKNNENIAEGNIIGACTINSCLVLGAGAFISDIPLSSDNLHDLIFLLASIVLIFLFGLTNKNNTIKRCNGAILLAIYVVYSIRLFI